MSPHTRPYRMVVESRNAGDRDYSRRLHSPAHDLARERLRVISHWPTVPMPEEPRRRSPIVMLAAGMVAGWAIINIIGGVF